MDAQNSPMEGIRSPILNAPTPSNIQDQSLSAPLMSNIQHRSQHKESLEVGGPYSAPIKQQNSGTESKAPSVISQSMQTESAVDLAVTQPTSKSHSIRLTQNNFEIPYTDLTQVQQMRNLIICAYSSSLP